MQDRFVYAAQAAPGASASARARHCLGEAQKARLAEPAVHLMIAVSAGLTGEAAPHPHRMPGYRFGLAAW